jgi:hypothetical protein
VPDERDGRRFEERGRLRDILATFAMNVLVDYDNIVPAERNKGLIYLVERSIYAATLLKAPVSNRVDVRLGDVPAPVELEN